MLKLKDAAYPDPERPVLHNEYAEEVTYDLGKDGSKWAHGYIPLNPAAVALKSHKTPGGHNDGPTGDQSTWSPAKRAAHKANVAEMRKSTADHAAAVRKDTKSVNFGKPTAAKSAEPREFKTMAQTRKEASARAFVNSGDVRLHATKDDGGSKIGTVSKYPSGGFRAQHKDDATAHAGSPFKTRQEAVGALVLQHEARTPKTQSERVADIRAGKVQVYNVKTGKSEHVSPAEATAGHVRYGQSLGAGSAAAGQTVKNALEAEKARRAAADPKTTNSTGLRTLGGYGTNDLKAIANVKGAYASNPPSADTIAKAEAELKSRGYVKGPSGVWAKPTAPKRKRNTSNGLSTPASIKAARERERTRQNSATHSLGSR